MASNAISTAAIPTVRTLNWLPFRPIAKPTSFNSTYLIRFKVSQFFQDVPKRLKWVKNQQSATLWKVILNKLPNVPNLRMMCPKLIRKKSGTICISLGQQNLKGFWFLITSFELLPKKLASPYNKCTSNLTKDSVSCIKLYSQSCYCYETHSRKLQGSVTTRKSRILRAYFSFFCNKNRIIEIFLEKNLWHEYLQQIERNKTCKNLYKDAFHLMFVLL